MTSCDTNILLYYFNEESAEHAAAKRYLEAMWRSEEFAICELVLVELYVHLRNPEIVAEPLTARRAADVVQGLRSNLRWSVIDYPGGLMNGVWRDASEHGFARRAIYDARLARTLRHYGVREFATRNVKDFEGFGFDRVFNPID